jgi:hypothetical protein
VLYQLPFEYVGGDGKAGAKPEAPTRYNHRE